MNHSYKASIKLSIYLILVLQILGCASTQTSEASKNKNARNLSIKKQKLQALQNLKKQEQLNQQKELAWIKQSQDLQTKTLELQNAEVSQAPQLPKNLQGTGAEFSSNATQLPTKLPPKIENPKSVLPTEPVVESESLEQRLYVKVLSSYQAHQLKELNRATELLCKTFPNSIFADRAIFLSARLKAEKADYKAALIDLKKIELNYPDGSKVVSAKFLESQIYQKMGQTRKSELQFKELQKQYPGSVESLRADYELKIMSMMNKKENSSKSLNQ